MSAIVAIVGRPNVGKSTLFNRLVGKRTAIESEIPGTTRDRLYHTVNLSGYSVLLVDTGGLEMGNEGGHIEENVQEQSRIAIDGADVILFVVDVRSPLTSEDFHAADLLRKSKKKVILVANKCDNPTLEEGRYNLYELGFGEPLAVTALHSGGLDILENKVGAELTVLEFPRDEDVVEDKSRIKIAFLGRPNVGKSTMVNGLFGKERVVTSDIPGTTRDSSHIPFDYEGIPFTLIDTAGIRRRGKIEKGIEKYSILRTMQAVDDADVCVLLMDFKEGVANQDCHVTQYILERKKGLILVVNKTDVVDGSERESAQNYFIRKLRQKMAYIPWAPVVFSSALKRKNLFPILELAEKIIKERARIVKEENLNVWLEMVLAKHPPMGRRGKRFVKIHSVKQVSSDPPHFSFKCDWPEIMHFSYARFLENEIREQFGFTGTPISFTFRTK
jgi:GTP-binding protein